MRPNTRLTQQQLRLYMAQRNTDTPDGGGQMTAAVLTGKDNELFPPVSDLDLARGRLNMRLVYCAVLTDFAAALWGANVILSEPPRSKNVSYLMFRADGYAQERHAAMRRMEAYLVPASHSRLTLLNTQLKGSRQITAYQHTEAPLPVAGESYALQYSDSAGRKAHAFFRVAEVFSEIRTYEDEKGEFQRRFVRLKTQDALEQDFEGLETASRYYRKPDVLILETQVADSGQYYGISALAAPVRAGDSVIRAAAAYQQIVPTSVVETAHVDDFAGGKGLWIETGARRTVAQAGWIADGNLYLDTSVLPGSVQLSGWTDDASGSLKNGAAVLRIDYEKGVIYGIKGLQAGEVSAVPAARYYNHAYASVVEIDQTNIGTDYIFTLRPQPARGSVSVAFLHRKKWYWLHDNGQYVLTDADGNRRGAVSRNGSVAVTLPALPDEGSTVVCYWAPVGFYKTLDGAEAGSPIRPRTAEILTALPELPKPFLKPSTVQLSWNDGASREANDSNGLLQGSCSGYADYAAGRVYPRGLTAASVRIRAQQYVAAPERKMVAVEDGSTMVLRLGGTVQPGTLSLVLPLGRRESARSEVVQAAPAVPARNYRVITV